MDSDKNVQDVMSHSCNVKEVDFLVNCSSSRSRLCANLKLGNNISLTGKISIAKKNFDISSSIANHNEGKKKGLHLQVGFTRPTNDLFKPSGPIKKTKFGNDQSLALKVAIQMNSISDNNKANQCCTEARQKDEVDLVDNHSNTHGKVETSKEDVIFERKDIVSQSDKLESCFDTFPILHDPFIGKDEETVGKDH